MTTVAFEGLTAAPDTDHARWVVDAMADRDGVANEIPDGFAAYARLLHPLDDGRWAETAPQFLVSGKRARDYGYPFRDEVDNVAGDMGDGLADRLAELLAPATSTPQRCHFGLWVGWGGFNGGSHAFAISTTTPTPPQLMAVYRGISDGLAIMVAFTSACPVQPWWGGRDMLLFDGPVHRVDAIGSPWGDGTLNRRGPQWWWPSDRAWFVATEIDNPWTYVGGSAELVATILADPDIEGVPIAIDDAW